VLISLQPAMSSSPCRVPGAADAADAGDAAEQGYSPEVWTRLQDHVLDSLRQAEDGLLDAQAVPIDVDDDVCAGLSQDDIMRGSSRPLDDVVLRKVHAHVVMAHQARVRQVRALALRRL
jgi:hypothetical protein